jgi:pseudouridine-5'-phosphate glycosidase
VSIPAAEVAGWIDAATADAERDGITGGAVTPYILGRVADLSGGRTLRANIGLIVNNAGTAGRIAVADARGSEATA